MNSSAELDEPPKASFSDPCGEFKLVAYSSQLGQRSDQFINNFVLLLIAAAVSRFTEGTSMIFMFVRFSEPLTIHTTTRSRHFVYAGRDNSAITVHQRSSNLSR